MEGNDMERNEERRGVEMRQKKKRDHSNTNKTQITQHLHHTAPLSTKPMSSLLSSH
jgi:hypothetical protein